MRKASTRRSERRARARSTGGILMMACYVTLKDMYKEPLRLICPRSKDVVKGSNCLLAERQLNARGRERDTQGTGVGIGNADVGKMLLELGKKEGRTGRDVRRRMT